MPFVEGSGHPLHRPAALTRSEVLPVKRCDCFMHIPIKRIVPEKARQLPSAQTFSFPGTCSEAGAGGFGATGRLAQDRHGLSGLEGCLANMEGFSVNIDMEYSPFTGSRTGMSNILTFFVPGWFYIRAKMFIINCQMFKPRCLLSKILGKTFNIRIAFRDGTTNISAGPFNI